MKFEAKLKPFSFGYFLVLGSRHNAVPRRDGNERRNNLPVCYGLDCFAFKPGNSNATVCCACRQFLTSSAVPFFFACSITCRRTHTYELQNSSFTLRSSPLFDLIPFCQRTNLAAYNIVYVKVNIG